MSTSTRTVTTARMTGRPRTPSAALASRRPLSISSDPANTNFEQTFTRADNSNGNYVKFSITATGFTLSASPAAPATGTRRAPVNGIQIVPVASADFTITASPASRTVTAGASTSYTAAISSLNGFSGTVGLAVTGAPGGHYRDVYSGLGERLRNRNTRHHDLVGHARRKFDADDHGNERAAESHRHGDARRQRATRRRRGDRHRLRSVAARRRWLPGESAGVVPQTHWNSAAGATRSTPLTLVDESGTLTNASVTWTAKGGWMTPITD